jgi:hypothetical protein
MTIVPEYDQAAHCGVNRESNAGKQDIATRPHRELSHQ